MKNINVDLNLFRVFDRVISEKSISAAANSLEMTSSAISQSIRRLGEIVGEPLFRRDGRGIKPTSRAFILHAEICDALHTMERSIQLNQEFIPKNSHRIFRIASHPDLDVLILPKLLVHLAEVAPNCRIDIVPKVYEEYERHHMLRLHSIDMVLTSSALEEFGFYNIQLLELEPRVACRVEHPRIRDQLDFEAFFSEEHVVWDIQRNDDWVLRSLTHHSLPPRKVLYQSNSLLTALALISQTDWLCVTTRTHLNILGNQLDIKDFPIPWKSDPCPIFINLHHSSRYDPGINWLLKQMQLILSAT